MDVFSENILSLQERYVEIKKICGEKQKKIQFLVKSIEDNTSIIYGYKRDLERIRFEKDIVKHYHKVLWPLRKKWLKKFIQYGFILLVIAFFAIFPFFGFGFLLFSTSIGLALFLGGSLFFSYRRETKAFREIKKMKNQMILDREEEEIISNIYELEEVNDHLECQLEDIYKDKKEMKNLLRKINQVIQKLAISQSQLVDQHLRIFDLDPTPFYDFQKVSNEADQVLKLHLPKNAINQ